MNIRFTRRQRMEIEEILQLRREAVKLLRLIVAEWENDPMSVQCFDLRIVKRAKEVIAKIKKLDIFDQTT